MRTDDVQSSRAILLCAILLASGPAAVSGGSSGAEPAACTQGLTVTVSPPSAGLAVGAQQRFDAQVMCGGSDVTSSSTVNWSIHVAPIGSVNPATGAGTTFTATKAGNGVVRADASYQGSSAGKEAQVSVSGSGPDPAFDDFERSSLGGNWNAWIGNCGIANSSDLGMLAASGMCGVSWTASTFAADSFSEGKISADKPGNMMGQVYVRRRAADNARYGFHWNDESTFKWEIKYDGVPTAQTRIVASAAGTAPKPGDVIRIEARGNVIKGFNNGVEVVSAADNEPSAITPPGPAGFAYRLVKNTTTTYPASVWEEWRGGSLGGGGGGGAAVQVTIHANARRQTMDGWGATHGAGTAGLIDYLTPQQRADAIDKVYSAIGLSIGGVQGGLLESPGDYNSRRNDNSDPSTIDWKGFNPDWALNIKTKMLDAARAKGFENFYIAQKVNVRYASPWMDPIRTSNYSAYLDEAAEQMLAGYSWWKSNQSIEKYYMQPFNEPTSGNRELLNGGTQDVVDIIKRAGARLNAAGFTTRFVAPEEETVSGSQGVAKAILADPDARQYIAALGYHPYPYGSPYVSIASILSGPGAGNPDQKEVAERNQIRDLGRQYGIPVWMTEVSNGGVSALTYDDFRGRAIHVHDELEYADAAAYYGMGNFWDTRSAKDHGLSGDINSQDHEGTFVMVDTIGNGQVYITGIGYAVGHYSRFVKKGAVHVDDTVSDPLAMASAFRDDASNRLVVVMINNAPATRQTNVSLSAWNVSGNVWGEQSTENGGYWKPLTPFPPKSPAEFAISLPALSVTTLVMNGTGGGAQAPAVLSTAPADGATGVPSTTIIDVTFSLPMDAAATQAAVSSTPAIPGSFSWSSGDSKLTLTPTSPLAEGTKHTFTISAGAKSKQGVPLPGPFVFSFTTATGGGSQAPAILSTVPASGTRDADLTSSIEILFSVPMDAPSTEGAVSATPGIAGGFTWDAGMARLSWDPSANLQPGTMYSVAISTAAKSAQAVALPSVYSFSFTTRSQPGDATPPSIAHTPPGPVDEGAEVAIVATVSDAGGVKGVTLSYRRPGQPAFASILMARSTGDEFRATVPAGEVKTPRVEYYFEAEDLAGNRAVSPAGAPATLHSFEVKAKAGGPPAGGNGGGASDLFSSPVALGLLALVLVAAAVAAAVVLARRRRRRPEMPAPFREQPPPGP